MTLTVNGHEAEPGCYVDGHWGQYGGRHLFERAHEFMSEGSAFDAELGEIFIAWPMNHDGTLCGAYGSDRDADRGKATGPWAAIQNFGDTDGQTAMELADAVLELLNEHTEGGYWEWGDGEVFLVSYVCDQCGRDALNPTREELRHCGDGDSIAVIEAEPCDYCCDADDPGVYA